MHMRGQSILLCLTLNLFVVGCMARNPITTEPGDASPTAPASQPIITALSTDGGPAASGIASSPSPSRTALPTVTPSLAVTITPSLSPLVPPQGELAAQYLDILPELPPEAGIEGVLVLDSRLEVNRRVTGDTFLLNLATGDSRQIANEPGENQIDHTVSPDRTLLAYRSAIVDASDNISNEELVISDATGQRLKSIPWEEGWVGIPGWLDNHRLVIRHTGLDSDENQVLKPATLLLLDPFTGKRQVLKPDFTGIYGTPKAYWDGWGGTLYDPTLTRVIYPYLGDDDLYTYALWDLQKQKLVTTLEAVFAGPVSVDWAPMPIWSPDGSRLVVTGIAKDANGDIVFETYLVTRDGQVEQLTDLHENKRAELEMYSWSPDGRYIAAWLFTDENRERSVMSDLVIVDTQTRHDHRLLYQNRIRTLDRVWSPDGQQLIVTERTGGTDPSTVRYRVILVDLARGFAAQIKEEVEAFGG